MAMPKAEREFHRKVAARCFNRTWEYLEMEGRSADDDRDMLLLAHASRYHWGLVGTAANRAVGDWQLSRVYAALDEADLALLFARSSLSTSEENGIVEVIPSAYEGVARAFAAAKDSKRAEKYLAKARKKLRGLDIGKKERMVYAEQIDDTQRLISRL